jgi:YHS domain-containing protein
MNIKGGIDVRAKCRICGEPLDTNTAYKVVVNNKKAYYCSQEEFEADQTKKKKVAEDKDKVYRLVCDIIGRKEITNTALFAEWKIWNKVADNEIIGKYLDENKEYLCGVAAKLEDKEFNRIRYLSAILKNKLGDYRPKTEVKPVFAPKIQEEHYETKFKSKGRAALLDFEEDCDE